MPTVVLPHHEGELELAFQNEALAIAAEPIARGIAAQIAGGARFLPGQSVEIGIVRAVVEDAGEGKVRLDVEPALKALVFARFTAQSFGVETLDLPSSGALVTVCDNFRHTEGFKMQRGAAEFEGDSGWTVVCLAGKLAHHDHKRSETMRRVPLAELIAGRPACVKYLGLPDGTYVDYRAGGAPRVWSGDDERRLVPGSYLDACLKREAFTIDFEAEPDLAAPIDADASVVTLGHTLAERYTLEQQTAWAAIERARRERARAALVALGLEDAIAAHGEALLGPSPRAYQDVLKALRVRTKRPLPELEKYAEWIRRAAKA